jgi:hypothetical protein
LAFTSDGCWIHIPALQNANNAPQRFKTGLFEMISYHMQLRIQSNISIFEFAPQDKESKKISL